MTYLRDLSGGEILELMNSPPVPAVVAPLQKLRAAHHEVAKLVAEGRSSTMISAITGRTTASIYQLKQDPAFQELVSHYGSQIEEIFSDAQKRLADLGLTAVEILQERLEDPEALAKMGTGTILGIMESAMDRSIAPNKGRANGQFGQGQVAAAPSVTLNVKFGAEPGHQPGLTLDLTPNPPGGSDDL